MPPSDGFFYLRMGSNSEKDYIKKTINFFSGLVIKANYFESAPGMLSSLFLNISSEPLNKSYIIDPVTFVFTYDPYEEGSIRTWQKVIEDKADQKLIDDLRLKDKSEIKSDWKRKISVPKVNQKNKIEIRGIMKSYRKIGDILFPKIISDLIGKRPLASNDFNNNSDCEIFIKNSIEYQNNAIRSSKYSIEKYIELATELPKPNYILCPYFIIKDEDWFSVMKNLWFIFSQMYRNKNAAIVFHVDLNFLVHNFDEIITTLDKIDVQNVFIWLNNFKEETNNDIHIEFFIKLVIELSRRGKNIINMYAGGLSIYLIPFGLKGIINSPGYGLDRNAEPIKGGIPVAQFYIPSFGRRMPVLESYLLIQRNNLEITAKSDYHREICNCPICQKGIIEGIRDLVFYYGEVGDPIIGKDSIERRYPTKEALDRCRYHFLFSRLIEYRWALSATKKDSLTLLQKNVEKWTVDNDHLKRWYNILSKYD